MNPLPALTDQERAKVRKEVFAQNRSDPLFVLEAMGCYFDWHKAHLAGESLETTRAIDKAVLDYCERCGLFETAEDELLASKQVNGKRYLTA
jgi:hypothetical protein